MDHRHLELPRLACLNALIPTVTEVCITSTSAFSEPSPSAATAATFTRILHGAALGAYMTDGKCHDS